MTSPVPPALRLPGPYPAVVFDLDGLLVHTERQWLQAKVTLFERHGRELTEADQVAVFGAADLQSVTYFAGRFGLPPERIAGLQTEYLDIIGSLIDKGVELTDGSAELIERVSGKVPVALASNTRRTLVDRILVQTPFGQHIDAISTGDEVAPKPAPDVYLLACERLGVDPTGAVAVEDSPTGIRAAQSAGLTCIGVPSNPREPLEMADLVVESLTELL